MKIIFLDFDGVLNSTTSLWWWQHKNATFNKSLAGPNQYAVSILCQLVEDTDARIVISSSWRYGKNMIDLMRILQYDFMTTSKTASALLDKIGHMTTDKNEEILRWMKISTFDIESFVILDDDMIDHPGLVDNFIRVDRESGLTISDYIKARDILERKKYV